MPESGTRIIAILFAMTISASRLRAFALAAASAVMFSGPSSAQALETRYRYAGFLQDAQVLTLQLDMAAPDQASYRVGMGGDLVGMLAGMYPFHMQLASQGRVSGQASLPSQYRSDITSADDRRIVTLTYGAGGNIQMYDQPPTQEGQDAFARGLVRGTMDPLSAVAMIARKIAGGQGCSGRVQVFDGARRFDLTLSPVPAAATPPRNLPLALAAPPKGCDAALTLLSGFPRSAVESGVYPKSARFWFAADPHSPWPVLLRIDADSGLGHLHMDYVSAE
jgi:hypothetical protein